ncbi:hypothetical protein BH09MYX1_BH09MYX1_46780 [soil metagenome]
MTEPPRAEPGFVRRHAARFIASIVLTVCVVWALRHSGLNLIPPWSAFAHVRWWTVPTYFLFVAAMTYFRAVRWRHLLRRVASVPTRRLLSISLVGFAAILLLPFRLGEFVRPAMLRQKGKVSFSAATGSIIADRIVDGLYLSGVLAVALAVVPTIRPLPETIVGLAPLTTGQIRGYAFFTLIGFTGALTTIAVYFFARKWAHRATIAVFGIVSKKLAERLAHEAERLADGLDVLRSPKDAAGFLLETTLYWLINACGMWFLAWGAGLEHADGSPPTFGEAAGMMGMLGITILVPGPPGLLGIFQAGMFCGMTFYFPTAIVQERGAVYACLLFLVQVTFTVTAGGIAFFAGHGSLKTIAAAEKVEPVQEAPTTS